MPARLLQKGLKEFLDTDMLGGLLLVVAAVLAILVANSPLSGFYEKFLTLPVSIYAGEIGLSKSLHHWINDGLMALFFFLVGLEIKREIVTGELSSAQKAALPAFAALGGMVIPALIYYFINRHTPANLAGWAIPSATDIAFALGILSILGRGVPVALKVLLVTIAVLDDLGAIIVIALFYTADLSLLALGIAGLCIAALFIINRAGVTKPAAYILIGIIMWTAVLKSGVHATLAGVATALFIPLTRKDARGNMLEDMAHALHPWVIFGIMPLFAFANAGVSFEGIRLPNLGDPLPLGIIAGLFIGKQIGVFGLLALSIRTGVCALPQGVTWRHLYGISLLCGIGFTMSLFIGSLAFPSGAQDSMVRLGVLCGSLLSSVAGYMVLKAAITK